MQIDMEIVEAVLRRERGCIDPMDVAQILALIYVEAGQPVPFDIETEVEDNAADNIEGCDDPAGPDCHDDSCEHHYGEIGSLDEPDRDAYEADGLPGRDS